MSRHWASDPYDDYDDSDRYDSRDDDFRCYGCEANIGRGGYCEACKDEWEAQHMAKPKGETQ